MPGKVHFHVSQAMPTVSGATPKINVEVCSDTPYVAAPSNLEQMAALVDVLTPSIVKSLLRNSSKVSLLGELRGGAIRSILLHQDWNDWDVYFDSKVDANHAITYLASLHNKVNPITGKMVSVSTTIADKAYPGNVNKVYTVLYEEGSQFQIGYERHVIDIVVGSREKYKQSLDYTVNAAYFDGKVLGTLVDYALFKWALDERMLIPLHPSYKNHISSVRFTEMKSKGFVSIKQLPSTLLEDTLVDLLKGLDAL